MTGMDRYSEKERRSQRRRNHVVRDLGPVKYRPRVINNKKYFEYEDDYEIEE